MLRMSVRRLHQQRCRDRCYRERAQGASILFIALVAGGVRGVCTGRLLWRNTLANHRAATFR